MRGKVFYRVIRDGLSEEETQDQRENDGRDKAMQICDR